MKYLTQENNILTGIHNLNNKEFQPILTDMFSTNKDVFSTDGSGISTFQSEINRCNTLNSYIMKIKFNSFIFVLTLLILYY